MLFRINPSVSINETLKKLEKGDILELEDGIYHEKVKVTTPGITIIGKGKNTIIANKDYYNKIHEDNKEYLTVRTYTFMVQAENVTLKNLTISNESVPNSVYGQAVALHVIGDHFICESCNLLGAQDTLLAGPIPYDLTVRYKNLLPEDELIQPVSHQLYKNCYIQGDVDFIFGSAVAYFDNCHLHSIGKGYVCAPSHNKELKYGYVFNNCLLDSENTNDEAVCLARPWRDYGYAAFINCKVLGNYINKELFNNWTKDRESTCRFFIYNTIDTSHMVKFAKELSKEEAIKINQKEVLGF